MKNASPAKEKRILKRTTVLSTLDDTYANTETDIEYSTYVNTHTSVVVIHYTRCTDCYTVNDAVKVKYAVKQPVLYNYVPVLTTILPV